jgi:hypothetical protein
MMNEYSLFQPFERLPLEIFRILQEYLGDTTLDYKSLLDTNRRIFSQVKYETLRYFFTINGCTASPDPRLQIFNRVRDPGRQIWILFVDRSYSHGYQPVNINHYNLCSQIYGLTVHLPSAKIPTLSSCIGWKHVRFLFLSKVCILQNLDNLPVENIEDLVLYKLPELVDISQIEKMKNLVSVDIKDCKSLCDISSLKNVAVVSVSYCASINGLKHVGNHDRFSFVSTRISKFDISSLVSVKSVLSISAFIQECDLSGFKNIVDLKLLNYSKNLPFSISTFNGKRLSLRGFTLSFIADKSSIMHLEYLFLNVCVEVPLSIVILVPSLELYECAFQKEDPLTFEDMASINELNITGALPEAFLAYQSLFGNLSSLTVKYCYDYLDISSFGYIKKLCISCCDRIISLEGLGKRNKEVEITRLPEVVDFSPLNGIYRVKIIDCSGLTNGKGLENVRHLAIMSCENFSDTSQLGQVHSLRLEELPMLVSLKGLQNVRYLSYIYVIICKILMI